MPFSNPIIPVYFHKFTRIGTVATCIAAGVENAIAAGSFNSASDSPFVAEMRRLYRIDVKSPHWTAAAFGTTVSSAIRLRKTHGSTTAQLLGLTQVECSSDGTVIDEQWSVYIKNETGADVSFDPGLTIALGTGGANVSLFGDNDVPLSITMTDIGAAADYPAITANTTEIA